MTLETLLSLFDKLRALWDLAKAMRPICALIGHDRFSVARWRGAEGVVCVRCGAGWVEYDGRTYGG